MNGFLATPFFSFQHVLRGDAEDPLEGA